MRFISFKKNLVLSQCLISLIKLHQRTLSMGCLLFFVMFIEHIRVNSLLKIKLNSNFHGVIVPFSDPIMYHCKQHWAECIGLISEESISHQTWQCHHFHVFLHHWYWMKCLTKAPRILEPKTQTLLWSTNPPKFTSPSRTFP